MPGRRRLFILLLLPIAGSFLTNLVILVIAVRVVPTILRVNAPQEYHLFTRWNRPWSAFEIRYLGRACVNWATTSSGPDAQSPPDEVIVEWRRDLAPRIAQVPGRTLVDTVPSWGSMTAAMPPPDTMGADIGFGWPLVCLWYRQLGEFSRFDGAWSLSGVPPPRASRFPLPGFIDPMGLIADLVIWSLPWALLTLYVPRLRRWLRRRRGCCSRCNYDLRALPAGSPCPECGPAPTTEHPLQRHVAPSAADRRPVS